MKKRLALLIFALFFSMLAGSTSIFNCNIVKADYITNPPSSTSLVQLWNTTKFGNINRNTAPPILTNDRIYVSGNNILCLDATTGTKIWNYTLGGTIFTVTNGNVYAIGSTGVLCLSAATGSKIWNYTTPPFGNPSLAVGNGFVYVNDYYNPTYYCLDASTGKFIWQFTSSDLGWATLTFPVFANGYVYICNGKTGSLDCFLAQPGTNLWNSSTSPVVWQSSAFGYFVVSGNYLYMDRYNGNICCLNAITGTLIWNKTGLPLSDYVASLAVANSNVYSISPNNIYCLNAATGDIRWWQSYSVVTLGRSVNVNNGYVYVGGAALYCFDASNGNFIWGFQDPSESQSHRFLYFPVIGNGFIYLSDYNGITYAYKPESIMPTSSSTSSNGPPSSSPSVPEFPAQVIGFAFLALIIILSFVIIAKRGRPSKMNSDLININK